MTSIKLLNKISPVVNEILDDKRYTVSETAEGAEGILVRSAKILDMEFEKELLCIARAGAGYNNIPVDRCSEKGIVVFNTPGANANAVKELTIAGMLLAGRDIAGGMAWVRSLKGESDIAGLVEKGKGQFTGPELKGKKLAIIGLGAIGTMLANAARGLDMEVCGYDPYLSVDHALMLTRSVHISRDIHEALADADFISVHIPLNDATKGSINREYMEAFKDGAVLLNFARGELVDTNAVLEALASGKLRRYVTDFPTSEMLDNPAVIALPHLGASTPESEENCAEMAAKQVDAYLTRGAIINSVNYPVCDPGYVENCRLCILHANVPGMVNMITGFLAHDGINIGNMMNKSRGNVAYTVVDLDTEVTAESAALLTSLEGIYKVRVIK